MDPRLRNAPSSFAITWATDFAGKGNAYGFTLGNRLGREAAIGAGVRIDPDADVAVHHCPPHCFGPMPGKVNVLWTAWEFSELIPAETEGLKKADVLFATARFLVDVFEQATAVPTFYVPQGIRTDVFTETRRRRPPSIVHRPSSPFRYLWVGAPNDRKGWRHVLGAWRAFAEDPTCELYLKTTFAAAELRSGRFGNVVIDTEERSDQDMAALYHSAHCFVFPSMGEGFGFTLGEAMATGLPCIYTPATSLTDLCNAACGYPLKYRTDRCFRMEFPRGERHCLPAANPDVRDLVRRMRQVRRQYAAALRKGRRAAARIRERFTWAHAGRCLRQKLELVAEQLKTVQGAAVST